MLSCVGLRSEGDLRAMVKNGTLRTNCGAMIRGEKRVASRGPRCFSAVGGNSARLTISKRMKRPSVQAVVLAAGPAVGTFDLERHVGDLEGIVHGVGHGDAGCVLIRPLREYDVGGH